MGESNRLYKRKNFSIPFTYEAEDYPPVASPLHAMPGSATGILEKPRYAGRMKNTSSDGFCFETGKSLLPGTDIEIKMVDFNPIQLGGTEYSDCRATVRWCHKSGSIEDECFEIGARRKREDTLPLINFKSRHFGSLKCM